MHPILGYVLSSNEMVSRVERGSISIQAPASPERTSANTTSSMLSSVPERVDLSLPSGKSRKLRMTLYSLIVTAGITEHQACQQQQLKPGPHTIPGDSGD